MASRDVPWWALPLDRPPRLVLAGLGRHGRRGVERYRLPSLWVVHLYDYAAELTLDGRTVAIEPGSVGITPPGVEMTYHYRKPVEHLFAHFAADEGGGDGARSAGADAAGAPLAAPAIQRTGRERFERWRASMGQVIDWQTERPARAAARFWELLWQWVDHGRDAQPGRPTERTELAEARSIIERRLGEPLRIADLAAEVGLSHNHLTRLFRQAEGVTAIEYLNRRRAERAIHLLRQTTLPIKAIALEVGMTDLPRFNKFIRQRFGRSPRAVRSAADGR